MAISKEIVLKDFIISILFIQIRFISTVFREIPPFIETLSLIGMIWGQKETADIK